MSNKFKSDHFGWVGSLPIAVLLFGWPAQAADRAETKAATPTVSELIEKTDDLMRGKSSEGKVTMHVKTARWDRKLTMKMWSKGTEKTLIQILSPAKEKGTATLKVDKDIWNYLPKVDRTIKVPASMMSGSWMGSHFTNDDLVKESRFIDDFDCKFTSLPKDNKQQQYVIDCIPKPDAPVVWGRVVIHVSGADQLVTEMLYYDEKGKLIRTMVYSDVGVLGGRKMPKRMKMVPQDKPGEYTEVIYEELQFDIKLSERTFSLQALRR